MDQAKFFVEEKSNNCDWKCNDSICANKRWDEIKECFEKFFIKPTRSWWVDLTVDSELETAKTLFLQKIKELWIKKCKNCLDWQRLVDEYKWCFDTTTLDKMLKLEIYDKLNIHSRLAWILKFKN